MFGRKSRKKGRGSVVVHSGAVHANTVDDFLATVHSKYTGIATIARRTVYFKNGKVVDKSEYFGAATSISPHDDDLESGYTAMSQQP